MNVFGPFHMQTREREDSAERNSFLEGEFWELFLYCLGLNFTHLSCFVFHFKNLYYFQVCWRCSPGHWLHALRPDRRAGRHVKAGKGHGLGGLGCENKNQWQRSDSN